MLILLLANLSLHHSSCFGRGGGRETGGRDTGQARATQADRQPSSARPARVGGGRRVAHLGLRARQHEAASQNVCGVGTLRHIQHILHHQQAGDPKPLLLAAGGLRRPAVEVASIGPNLAMPEFGQNFQ